MIRTLNNTNADEILVVDDTRAVIRSGTKLALIDLQQGKLIKHMRSEFPAKTYKVHRHASSLYKRRDLALRLAESPKVTAMSKPLKFSDCAVVGTTHVLVLSKDRLYLKVASLETGELVAKLKGGQKAMIENRHGQWQRLGCSVLLRKCTVDCLGPEGEEQEMHARG